MKLQHFLKLLKVEELYKNIILKSEFVNLETDLKMKEFLTKFKKLN